MGEPLFDLALEVQRLEGDLAHERLMRQAAERALSAVAGCDAAELLAGLYVEVWRWRLSRDRWRIAAGIASDTLCPQCGIGVSVDEDGLCSTCGCTAMGDAVDSRRASIEEAEADDMAAGLESDALEVSDG